MQGWGSWELVNGWNRWMGHPTACPSSHGLVPWISFSHNCEHLIMYFIIYRIAMSWIWSSILGSTEKRLKKKKHPQTSKSRGLRQTHFLTGPDRAVSSLSSVCKLLPPSSPSNMPMAPWSLALPTTCHHSLPSFTLQGLSTALGVTSTNASEGAVSSPYPVPRAPRSSLTSPRSTSHPAMPWGSGQTEKRSCLI